MHADRCLCFARPQVTQPIIGLQSYRLQRHITAPADIAADTAC